MRLAGLIGRVSEVRGFTMNAPVQMTADRLRRAMSLHQEGRHAEAQQAYREVLEAEPENFDALHLLGVAMAQTGRLELSAELIGKAIDLNPRSHSACCNLALTLVKLGRVADALVHCDQAIALKSDYSEAHALRANALFSLGRTEEALASCDRAIALDPHDVEAWTKRGAILFRLDRKEAALASYDKACGLAPNQANLQCDRGNVLYALGRSDAAKGCYEAAMSLGPDHAEAHSNFGNILNDQGRSEEALAYYDRAIALKPDYANAHSNRSNVLWKLGRYEEALVSSDRAIALEPTHVNALSNRATVLKDLGRIEDALASCQRALAIDPRHTNALSNCGNALKELGRLPESLECYDKAIALKSDHAEAWSNRANCLTEMGRLEQAIESYDRAIEIRPDYADAHGNRGAALHLLGRYAEALACYAKALALRPDYPTAELNEALPRLILGQFAEGWRKYEARKNKKNRNVITPRSYAVPEWLGEEDLAGKTILVHAEQGLGDTLQFCRYLRLLEARGTRVIFASQNALAALVRTVSPSVEVIGYEEVPARFDYHCYLVSLPLAFGTTLESIPAEVPYLRADPARVERWRKRLGTHGFKIGISWQGSTGKVDIGRSFPLAELAGLAHLPGVRLISLQKNAGTEQLGQLPKGMTVETLGEDFDAGADAFLDSAAVMECLDLVISSDTAVAHLAGALARPVWLALKHAPDWRWLLERTDSPWYPTARLFRQPVAGDWPGVFAAMTKALADQLDVGIPPPGSVSRRASDWVARGTELYRLGRRNEALSAMDQACALAPDDGQVHCDRGTVLLGLGRLDEALASYDRAIALAADQPEAHSNRGNVLNELGRPEEALASYDRAIALRADYASAHANRGNVLRALGRLEEALTSCDRAIELEPNQVAAHANRAAALRGLGRAEEALAGCDRALALDPRHVPALANRGNALRDLGRPAEAIESYDRAIALQPEQLNAWSNRGNALSDLRRFDEALASYDQAIALKPNYADAHSNRGNALWNLRRYEEALASCDRAITLDPTHVNAHINRAAVLKDLGRPTEALECYDKAIALEPAHAEAWSNRGHCLTGMARLEEALQSYDRAIEITPDYAAAWCNRGVTLHHLGRYSEAMACHAKALAIRPDYPAAELNDALTRLTLGQMAEAWPKYENRKNKEIRERAAPPRRYAVPEWLGKEDLAGKTILVHAEQALGDTLQLCRYLRLLERKGARVIFAAQNVLAALVRTVSPSIEVIGFEEVPARFDYHCYLASLPLAFGTTLESIPAEVPYLRAEPARVERWRQRLGSHGYKIGINWQGRKGKAELGRSFPLAELAGIVRLPGVRLISLQKNEGTEQLGQLPEGMTVETLGEDFDAGPDAFLDSAAVMECLDLVISSDTAVAHLAGALERPLWIALKEAPDWRWLLERTDSPWYPTARLFRQSEAGDWPGVFAAMAEALSRVISGIPPESVPDSFRRAIELHRNGRRVEAERLYEEILRREPEHFDAMHLLGVAALQGERFERGVELLRRAIAYRPRFAPAHGNLAAGLNGLQRFDEALASADLAIGLDPGLADAHANRANALRDLDRAEEALASCDRAIELDARHANAHVTRATLLQMLGRLEEALASCDRALAIDPRHLNALSKRGSVLSGLGRLDEALASYDAAVALAPGDAACWFNRGNALGDLGRFDEALASYDRAIEIKPDLADAHCNRGSKLHRLGRFEEALACSAKAVALRPDCAEAHVNAGATRLVLGQLAEGWPLYEWRKKVRGLIAARSYAAPEWLGKEDLAGKTILVHAEQGLGDTLQFCRYHRLLEAKGARVIFAAQNVLAALVRTVSPSVEVIGYEEVPARFDYHCYLASLPLAFGTTLESIPAEVPYLRADPARVERWRQRLGTHGFKIGISWQGSTGKVDIGRSFPVAELAGLARLPGVRLISLQKNAGTEQLGQLPKGMTVETLGDEFDAGADAFLDSAAVMECLDLVISSDTAVAHLAGALARPVWLALERFADWRWLLERTDSPWYPTARLFRQPSAGDWPSVFAEMAKALRDELDAGAGKRGPEPRHAKEWVARGTALYRLGRKNDALAAMDRACALAPDQGQVHCDRGTVLLGLGRLDEALASYDRAIALAADQPEAHSNRGNVLNELGRPEEALASYDRAIALRADYASAHANRGNVLRALGRLEEALASCDRAIALQRDHANAHANRASVLTKLGQFVEAIASADRALALEPRHANALSIRDEAVRGLGRSKPVAARAANALPVAKPQRSEEPGDRAEFDAAVALHRNGALIEAERAYRNVLDRNPRDFDALHLSAVIALQDSKFERGIELLRDAIAINPDFASAHCNLGAGLNSLGSHEEALASLDVAIGLDPALADAYTNRGSALQALGRHEEARQSYDRAIALGPAKAGTYNNRGNTLRALKQPIDALVDFDRAIDLEADYGDAFVNRGFALCDLKRHDGALASFDRAISLSPDHGRAHYGRAYALQALGRLEEALASSRRAIELLPDDAEAYNNCANVLSLLTRMPEALSCLDEAIRLDPRNMQSHRNRGTVLKALARNDEARASYRTALSLAPEDADSQLTLGLLDLEQGDFEHGLPLYEKRYQALDKVAQRDFSQPLWTGDAPLTGRTIFVHAEQGLGDTLQFCRYLKRLRAEGASVALGAQDELHRLLRTLDPDIRLVRYWNAPAEFDCHTYLMSLPLAFGTRIETIPAEVPYLAAEPDRVEHWRRRIGTHGFKIGIGWQGSKRPIDLGRSFPLDSFAGLARIPGVRLISLQKNDGSEQLATLPAGMAVETLGDDFDAGPDAFIDSAAVMQSLDLIITSDTALAHLAGALARPVWVALKLRPDWRWLVDRSDSPWYPTMRLFRQRTYGDWASVFAAIEEELRTHHAS